MTQVQRIQRLQETVNVLVEKETKPVWVKVGFVREKTGWRNEKMRQARQQGLIEYIRTNDGGFMYNIKSLDPIFFIK
jgi:hypothetical protein